MKSSELLIDTLGEGVLLFVVAAAGWAAHQPLVFASLGPTAYEQVARPDDRTSRLFNVIAGHLIGLAAGFVAVFVCGASGAPKVTVPGFVSAPRVAAIALAVTLTAGGTLLLKARQAAATATSLLVALGEMQSARGAAVIVTGIALIALIGEPVRRLRARQARP